MICRRCGVELTAANWYPSGMKHHDYICRTCSSSKSRKWSKTNPDKNTAKTTRYRRRNGVKSIAENKGCPSYLGVYVAERVLSNVFKNVERMPNNNLGYDFICNNGFLIDVKASTTRERGDWLFTINQNKIADYFLCIAFDNRTNLTPLHLWLIPGGVLNHLKSAGIAISTFPKWARYEHPVDRLIKCCDALKGAE